MAVVVVDAEAAVVTATVAIKTTGTLAKPTAGRRSPYCCHHDWPYSRPFVIAFAGFSVFRLLAPYLDPGVSPVAFASNDDARRTFPV